MTKGMVMKLDTRAVKSLERILEEELTLYVEYLVILAQEQASVISLKSDQVTLCSQRRAEIISRLEELRETRSVMIEKISQREVMRLTEFVEEFCVPSDKKRLLFLAGKIKVALKQVEEKSREFNQILNFSLGLVNGEISLLWSASQPVTRVYNAFGSVQEAVQPSPPRAGSLLGEA
jgi:xanthine dehydrogenase iron-sulfur cluster and FAD-binding subunit A